MPGTGFRRQRAPRSLFQHRQSRYIWSAMRSRIVAALLAAIVLGASRLAAQENPVRRVANIVNVAVEEYARGVDETGKLVLQIEYQEAVDFLGDARTQAARLPGDRAAIALAVLDSIIAAVAERRKPSEVKALEQRFAGALGAEAALETVVPGAAGENIAARAAHQRVIADTSSKCIVAGSTDDPVIPVTAVQAVVAGIADQGVVESVAGTLQVR